ncbi:hypothetical protein NEHOM01_0266 [Nematocida homosporus]|uniref:uncharacterized protein n=1 Tax=Nematocida homosporus TaxID=1912981 RepID=UPI00221F41A9|nr:uncharacterized protein NEHOM01_0266 [Nematocida homosporus]KAI5184591.1 hypothetical protein NEHOM01_0266 [Nematocida homosporus]
MDYLAWLAKTPAVNDMMGIEEYIRKEKEESVRVMKKRLRKGKETGKQRAEEILGEANKLYVQGQLNLSIDKIKEALSYHSTSDSAYYLLGVIYEEMDAEDKAFNAFLIAASIKKSDLLLWEKLYQQKKAVEDKEFQVYILKRIRKIKPSLSVLEEMLQVYQSLGQKEKVFEIRADLLPYLGFATDLVVDLLVNARSLKNKSRIIERISRELSKEKKILLAPDEFLIGFIDLLFVEEKYKELSTIQDSLVYLQRVPECWRSRVILFFAGLIAEMTSKCFVCRSSGHWCTCKDNLIIDEANHTLLVNGKESIMINAVPDIELLADPLHLVLTGHFMDVLLRLKKYALVLRLLQLVDAKADEVFPLELPDEPETLQVHKPIVTERLRIKQRLAVIYERVKEYDKCILQYKNILQYKEVLEGVAQNIFEETKMKISQIYEKAGNIDLALEYALQIKASEYQFEETIQRGSLFFHSAADCTRARSLLYKVQHICRSEMMQPEKADRAYFLASSRELIHLFLKNNFICFYLKKKKKKKRNSADKEILPGGQLLATKEFESDYALLQEINGLGQVCYDKEEAKDLSKSQKIYFDILASLLGGLSLEEWIELLKKYVISLYYEKSPVVSLLLLKKALSSSVLRTSLAGYADLLWLMIKIAIQSQDIASLGYAINQLTVFYSRRSSIDFSSFCYLGYFLLTQIPLYFKSKHFFMVQKNFQRALRRRLLRPGCNKPYTLTLLGLSYTPSFIYTDTMERLEKLMHTSRLPEIDTSLLGITRAITFASLFLTHASSRKVIDRNRYIKKGIHLLKSHLDYLLTHYPPTTPIQSPQITILPHSNSTPSILYQFQQTSTPNFLYTESDTTEKLALLYYNLGRAYHQYKLLGLAEKYYLQAIAHSTSMETHQLATINLSLLNRQVSIIPPTQI